MNTKYPLSRYPLLATILFCLSTFWLSANTPTFTTVDLELANLTTTTPDIYESATARFTIVNNGQNTATGIVVTFSKTQLNITGLPTVSLGSAQQHWTDQPFWEITSLAAGQSASIELPIFTLGSDYALFAEVTAQNETDVDSSPDNGNSITPIEDDEAVFPDDGGIGNGLPDLVITDFNFTDSITPFDNFYGFNATVANIGNGSASESFRINLYLSEDDVWDGDDYQLLCGIPTGNFAPGFSTTATSNCGPFPLLAPGQYFIILVIDNQEVIVESNETNNFVALPLTILPYISLPDLTISDFQIASSAPINSIVDYTIDMSNVGNRISGEFKLGVFLSNDAALSPDDVIVGEIPTGFFGAGANFDDVEGEINLDGITPSDYFLIAKIDSEEEEEEPDETNNIIVRPFTVTTGNMGGNTADLELSMTADNTTPAIYSTARITLTLQNNGPETATGISINLPKSPDWVIAGDGNVQAGQGVFNHAPFDIISWSTLSLNSGQSATVSFDIFTLANDANPYAQVVNSNQFDPDSSPNNGTPPQVNEDDEASLQDGGTPPADIDYLFSSSSVSPNRVLAEAESNFNVRVNRAGTLNGEFPYEVAFYISDDEQLSADDLLIGIDDRPVAHVPFNNREKYFYGTIPSNWVGNRFLIAVLDPNNLIAETDETNNTLTSPVEVIENDYDGCTFEMSGNEILCHELNGNRVALYVREGSNILLYEIDEQANVSPAQPFGSIAEDSVLVENNVLTDKLADGTIVNQQTIPANVLTIIPDIHQAARLESGGYILAGANGDELWALTTDEALNPIMSMALEGGLYESPVSLNDNRILKIDALNGSSTNPVLFYTYRDASDSELHRFKAVELLPSGSASEIRRAESKRLFGFRIIRTPCNDIKITYTADNTGIFGGLRAKRLLIIDRASGEVRAQGGQQLNFFANGNLNNSNVAYFDFTEPFVDANIPFQDYLFGNGFVYPAIVEIESNSTPDPTVFRFPTDVTLPIQNVFQFSDITSVARINENVLLFSDRPVSGTITTAIRGYAHKCGPATGGDGTDIALTLSVNNSTLPLWSNVTYTLTATNVGDEAATGLIVDFDNGSQDPNKPLAFSGSDHPDYDSWNGIWNIGDLAPGEAQMVNVDMFTLQEAVPSVTLTAFVSSLNETDSNVANDEASATINVSGAANLQSTATGNELPSSNVSRPAIRNLYPNPAQSQVQLVIESPTIMDNIEVMVVDGFGKHLARQNIDLTIGVNIVIFEIGQLPEGMYTVYVNDGQKGQRMKRFVKIE